MFACEGGGGGGGSGGGGVVPVALGGRTRVPGRTMCGNGTEGNGGELLGREGPGRTNGIPGGPMDSKGLTFTSLLILFVVQCPVQVGSLCSHLH